MEEFYRRRWTDTNAADRFGDGEDLSDEITQQGLLPDVKYGSKYLKSISKTNHCVWQFV